MLPNLLFIVGVLSGKAVFTIVASPSSLGTVKSKVDSGHTY